MAGSKAKLREQIRMRGDGALLRGLTGAFIALVVLATVVAFALLSALRQR